LRQTRTYSVILRPEPEGGFTVRVPMLPEIVTHGDDEQHALSMARDAIALVLDSRLERGEPIPPADAPLYREVTVVAPAA
jgi:antitoxin HicB